MINPTKINNPESLNKELINFISQVEYSELITVTDNLPHIRPMVYVNDGLTIYMISAKQTAKVSQIKANPNVSVMIVKSFQASSETKELIVEGRASFVTDQSLRAKVFELFKQKPQTFQEWVDKEHADYEVIKIIPHLLRYFDYAHGQGEPNILKITA
ncbi:MAG: pyridoxamine 5'-phosphate oxidase family protein [Candidatus Schekmanbacteria bacterium]|nr:pyridoxamine 5'-phosphate oxidase family protein [Candidatus Schekmanbacteria bacterium]